MAKYKHVLLATDLSSLDSSIAAKAAQIVADNGAKFSMVHVIEPMPSYAYGYVDMSGLEDEMKKDSATHMQELAKKYEVAAQLQHIIIGHTKHSILQLAEDEGVDLIILGSHGKHGLQLLLGSTANAVLHGAQCDVLTVRIKD